MRHLSALIALALLPLTGYLWEEDCDVVVRDCVDICDTYCAPWGCWEECSTSCSDRCVDLPASATGECTRDGDCARGYVCNTDNACVEEADEGSVTPPVDDGTLCDPCAKTSDCEEGALCLQLDPERTDGYCGRACASSDDCPTSWECLQARDTFQCVPISRSCDGPVPID